MQKFVEDIKTKTYMDEGNYEIAIERLEAIILAPPSEDELLYAMIDEAYCYLRLTEEGEGGLRSSGLPECTIRPTSLTEYRQAVTELESCLSFNQDIFRKDQEEIPTVQVPKPTVFNLYNYPNPFNPTTTIGYDLPVTTKVSLKIYDVMGKLVKTLVNTQKDAGAYTVTWTGKNENSRDVASGIYFYRFESPEYNKTKRMVLLK